MSIIEKAVGLFKETNQEVLKVTWPTRRETVMTTVAIVVMAIIAGLFFLIVDSGLGYTVGKILGMRS